MKYKYVQSLPYSEILKITADDDVEEIWIVFAYFSKNIVTELFNSLKNRLNESIVHLVLSSSSVNPLQDVLDEISELSEFEWFDFHLVENPLMHSKLFAARYDENIKIYLGSANLTNNANAYNIESGIFLDFNNKNKTLKYLSELMNECHREHSILKLQTKSILSHFRSELLFLALEESKTRQAISIKPEKIRKVLTDFANNYGSEESTVTIKNRNMLNIFILDDDERNDLLEKEHSLKESIKDNFSIKLDGYGWVSSAWSMRRISGNDSPVKHHYDRYIHALKQCREKYNDIEYRRVLSKKIKKGILGWINENTGNNSSHYVQRIIDEELLVFELPITDKKSPYRKIDRLCEKLIESDDFVSLLNPYKIGEDENQETLQIDDIDILSVDRVNLLVMCQLAIKLRSHPGKGKIPAPPSVWWFDLALDKSAYGLYGYKTLQDYKNNTKIRLESIKADIREDINIDECVKNFCSATGFNLGARYPIVTKLLIWKDEDETIEDKPYAFMFSEHENHVRYNVNLSEWREFIELMLYIDINKITHEWELDENDVFLSFIEGEFVLGNNLRVYYEEDNYAYLCINSLHPKLNG